MLLLKKLLSVLLLPPLLPLLIVVAGLLLLRRKPRLGRGLAWGGVLLSLFLITPVSVNLLTTPLENVPVLDPVNLARGEAIVILGAGHRRYLPEYGGPTPNRLALERMRYGARLARASGLPVLVSGGGPSEYQSEAQLMAEALRVDFGVTPRWLEFRSLDTQGNAHFSAPMLKAAGVGRIILVTHAAHMRRALREFEAQGLQVIPAPLGFFSDVATGERFLDYLPGATAARASWYALHEWLGLLAQVPRLGAP